MPKYPDVTLAELCELLELKTGNWVSCPTMFRAARKIRVKPSKNQGSSQASIERVKNQDIVISNKNEKLFLLKREL